MSLVFIIGAGASHGESLVALAGAPPAPCETDVAPPVTTGFFKGDFLRSIGLPPESAAQIFSSAFDYIRSTKQIRPEVPVGQGPWESIDLEEILTSIDLSREFQSPDSELGAANVLLRHNLIRYLWRVITLCTLGKYGLYSRALVQSLPWDATLITFNYDLLLDQELITQDGLLTKYLYFRELALEQHRVPRQEETGLFLKMHGSLNWFRCANAKCPTGSRVEIEQDTTRCLERAMGTFIGKEGCPYCASETIPVIVPPVLRKPISEDSLIRTVWGLARRRLDVADTVVVIGFSAAPTDFYASWLIRTTVGVRSNADVIVVNPANDANDANHSEHLRRMSSIFPAQFNAGRLNQEFLTFAEIEGILDLLRSKGSVSRRVAPAQI